MSLGDSFPDDIKKKFAERNINLGNALLIHIPEFSITYEKYIIIVSTCGNKVELAYVVINSDPICNPHLKALNVEIDKDSHSFLAKDSYVDCSKIREFPIQYVIDFLTHNPERAVGNVSDEILKKIHVTLTTSKTIDRLTKVKYGFLN
ncbi:hypothetical protein [Flavobacterium sp. KJJ]|uniref:hypothetical protein n=1 Tax=Flavobacterium sp. KJJ TaxID=1270193 RepID=UPI0004938CF3|nr:hypothetical protein [Flavobacterium sp. KJJ]